MYQIICTAWFIDNVIPAAWLQLQTNAMVDTVIEQRPHLFTLRRSIKILFLCFYFVHLQRQNHKSSLVYEDCRHEESTPQVRAMERALKRSSEGQRLNKLICKKNVDGLLPTKKCRRLHECRGRFGFRSRGGAAEARKYTDAAGGNFSAPLIGTKRRNQSASTYKQKCPGCGSFDHVYKDCVYRLHPYFNTDPSIEYAQSLIGIRYFNKYGGRYIKGRDMNHTMHKNDRGGSMQRKRLRQEVFAALPTLGRERSVSRSSREPSQHSRGDSSGRAETVAYIPAHQRDRRIGESNSDSRRKEFYDRRREAESSFDRGHDYAKDRDRNMDYGKEKERDRHGGSVRDPRSSGRDPTTDRRSHSREKVDDHKKRAGDSRDKKDGKSDATSLLT